MPVRAKRFEYAIAVDRAGFLTAEGEGTIDPHSVWTADHLGLGPDPPRHPHEHLHRRRPSAKPANPKNGKRKLRRPSVSAYVLARYDTGRSRA